MAYIFGDGFDLYTATTDAGAGYWDSQNTGPLVGGRFAGSQAIQNINGSGIMLTKSSGVNDAVHHIICSLQQNTAFSGTSVVDYIQLLDGTTGQCAIVFRSDGAILLTSATPAGTTLATYTGALINVGTWYAFEFEVVIHPTAGSFTVRKNGNPSNDFTATSLNTRPGTNTYANKIQIGNNTASSSFNQRLDDLLWRSDAASVPWMGDIRCYTRLPLNDASAQFARVPATTTASQLLNNTSTADPTGTARYAPFTASITGNVASITVSFASGFTGNCKAAIFADSGGIPGAVVGVVSNLLVNGVTGFNTFTFSTPPPVIKGGAYWIGISHDVTASPTGQNTSPSSRTGTGVSYASFPASSPVTTASQPIMAFTVTITYGNNADLVNETLQDGTTTYVYDSTIGHADFYNLAPLAVTPASVVAVITRGFMEKSDAGFRSGAVQLKSGGTTVASPTLNLSTSWGWAWRIDTLDPNTAAPWTPVAVNNITIGPVVIG